MAATTGLETSVSWFGAQGVISPDGTHAALWVFSPGGTRVDLVDLKSGAVRRAQAGPGSANGDASSTLVFTPDSRILLVAAIAGVTPVDVRTGASLTDLPIPQVRVIALRPAR